MQLQGLQVAHVPMAKPSTPSLQGTSSGRSLMGLPVSLSMWVICLSRADSTEARSSPAVRKVLMACGRRARGQGGVGTGRLTVWCVVPSAV